MKLRNQLLTLFVVFFSLVSCVDDLEVRSTDERFDDEESLYSQPGAYTKAMAGVYSNLVITGPNGPGSSNLGGIDAGFSQYMRVWWYLQNMTSDETIWSYEGDTGTRELNRAIWDGNNPFFRGFYSRVMFQVALCNEFLRQSTDSKLNQRNVSADEREEIQKYREEARALRAMAYYHLMDTFGQAVLLTEQNQVGDAGQGVNRQQLFDFVESELLEVLPNLYGPNQAPYGRIDQGFARMVLAKAYLNAQVYISQDKNQECIDILTPMLGSYSLANNYLHNFTADNQLSPEMIFSVPSDGVRMQSYSAITVILNGQIGSLESNGVDFGMNAGGWGGALRVRKEFAEKFNGGQYTNDVRNTLIIGDRPIDIQDIGARGQGYIVSKFSNKTSTGSNGSSQEFPDTDFPMFRLADAYLMYAEAQVRKDGSANSTTLGYVNALRTRANNPNNSLTASDVTLDFILDERARELYWEGHRRQDLIRFNKFTGGSYNWQWKGGVQSGVSLPAHFKVFPFHPATLGANPSLTQNVGY
jgi:hypothetical protein